MKKLLFFLGILALTAAACNSKPTDNSQQIPPPSIPTTQTYSNATHGFSFDYPANLQFVTPSYANLEDKITQVQIPAGQYPGTNFGDAAFSVSAQFAKDLTACLKLSPPENGDGFKTKVTINGTDFYMTNSTGAGAGNLYESKIYRTVKSTGGACIELNETIHTSNIGNYPAGSVTEVDKTDVQAKLDAILNSFEFAQ